MACVVGVKLREDNKLYYFDVNGQQIDINDTVIVEMPYGLDCGTVIAENNIALKNEVENKLRKVVRKADEKDKEQLVRNAELEKRAFKICSEGIKRHKLDMNLVRVEYTFDGSKILFYFTAEGRVDFRNLVKDLANAFRTRIELRQIGVRDEAKVLGGLGICGRTFCCSSFMGEFQPVSIKMAKEQGLSLNPVKISGTCGRLMCCLKYEQDAYTDLLKQSPKLGAIVETPEGQGTVIDQNLIVGSLKVRLDKSPEALPITFNLNEVSIVKDGSIKVKKSEIETLKDLE